MAMEGCLSSGVHAGIYLSVDPELIIAIAEINAGLRAGKPSI
jgi:hypothetical protein